MKKIFLLLLAIIAVIVAVYSFNWYRNNRQAGFKSDFSIFLRAGDDIKSVITKLDTVVKDPARLEDVMQSMKSDQYLKPGCYHVKPGYTYVYFARMINNGWQNPVNLTLSGNLRVKSNIAAKIACQLMIDSASVVKALKDDELLAKYGFTSQNVFNLLIPDTYQMYWNASIDDILTTQKKAYDAFWNQKNCGLAEKLGLTREQVGILASIVEQETKNVDEMPLIAGVYLNRLHTNMPLQADPTVAYIYGYRLNRILKSHIETKSPYNTYKKQGLPPGPICVPSKDALNAVLHPDCGTPDGKPGNKGYFYFCANPDFSRTHLFARTLAEHNRNAAAFRKALDLRAAAKAAAENSDAGI